MSSVRGVVVDQAQRKSVYNAVMKQYRSCGHEQENLEADRTLLHRVPQTGVKETLDRRDVTSE